MSATCRCRARTARCRAGFTCPMMSNSPPLIVYAHGGGFRAGQPAELGSISCAIWCGRAVSQRCRSTTAGARASLPGRLRRHGGDDPAGGARRRRVRDRPDAARGRRRFRRRQSGARRGAGDARCRRDGAAVSAADLRLLLDRYRQPILAALRPGCRAVADEHALGLGNLSRKARSNGRTGAPHPFSPT